MSDQPQASQPDPYQRRDVEGEILWQLYIKGQNMILREHNIDKGQQVPINMKPLFTAKKK